MLSQDSRVNNTNRSFLWNLMKSVTFTIVRYLLHIPLIIPKNMWVYIILFFNFNNNITRSWFSCCSSIVIWITMLKTYGICVTRIWFRLIWTIICPVTWFFRLLIQITRFYFASSRVGRAIFYRSFLWRIRTYFS